jgi:hypothetical protein
MAHIRDTRIAIGSGTCRVQLSGDYAGLFGAVDFLWR